MMNEKNTYWIEKQKRIRWRQNTIKLTSITPSIARRPVSRDVFSIHMDNAVDCISLIAIFFVDIVVVVVDIS